MGRLKSVHVVILLLGTAFFALLALIPRLFPGIDAPISASCPPDAKRANLDLKLKDLEGRTLTLADYKGKVLLLDFWATWCGPCKVEIPGFIDLYRTYKPRGFEAVGVVVLDDFAKAGPFAQEYKMNYPIADGVDRSDVEEAYGPFIGLPTTYLIARDGRICARHIGLPPAKLNYPSPKSVKEAFEAEIRSLL